MMSNFYSAIFMISFLFLQFEFSLTKTTIVVYDEIRSCEDFCSGDECFEFFDLSKLKVILDEDDETLAYLNGTWVMNVPVSSPTPAIVWAEKRYGTKWATEAFYRRYDDACQGFQNPLDLLFPFFKEQKSCPYNVGDTLIWNMHKMSLPLVIPPSFIGEWRLLMSVVKEHEGKIKKQCSYFRGDIHEA